MASSSLGSATPLIYLDKCAVCDKPASKKCAGCSLAFYCGAHHQRVDWSRHKADCKLYQMVPQKKGSESNGEGGHLCLVASKLIPADTIVISEYPLVVFESSSSQEEDSLGKLLEIAGSCPVPCFGCNTGWITFSGVEGEKKEDVYRCPKCGLPLCTLECSKVVKNFKKHSEGDCKILQELGKKEVRGKTEIGRIPRDIRILRLIYNEKQKGTPISLKDNLPVTWVSLLKQAKELNSPFEKEDDIHHLFPLSLAATGGAKDGAEVVRLMDRLLTKYSLPVDPKNKRKRALFEKHCFLAHSCAPNLEWWVDTSGYHVKIIVRVIKPILPGELLTIFRSSDPTLLHNPTSRRRPKLQKQVIPPFPCECERCLDPTELGTCLSGIRCIVCKDVSATLTCNYYYPSNPIEKQSAWPCSGKNCRSVKTYEQILVITMKAEKELEQIWKEAMMVNSSSGAASQSEPVITKLQNFVVKHHRKILHPNHYLVLIARNRINKIVSQFLGSGEKLFLCVVTDQPRAYDYCAYKVEHLHAHLGFIRKLYDRGTTMTSGKLVYELIFCEAALLFREFQEERMGGASFFRRLHGIADNMSQCQKSLANYQDCKNLLADVKRFDQMLRKLFGIDFKSSQRVKLLQNSSLEEDTLRGKVKETMSKWTEACEKIGLRKLYIYPLENMQSGVATAGASNEHIITREDLQAILMDIPQTK